MCSYDVAGNMLLFGSEKGRIYLFDLEKFPLRLKDNDLLINLLYIDPDEAKVTALGVYESSMGSERCMEIAYGTDLGTVRIVVQVRLHALHRPALTCCLASRNHWPTTVAVSNLPSTSGTNLKSGLIFSQSHLGYN